ncbi:MAG: GTP cyclohydrolase FolE2 [candidate division WOR-3 bacterium]|jgi:GTP cyclohydrolase I|nr:GTP cyclohydrolase FolE2 [candidate division WOR-3 bacterium]MCR4423392.1 GTP cyclohydrolase FolE2 [candidate division WOR-3 bacterium]MDH7518731.1 GTP cyclohydrolase FolE2 [bacterium]
MNDPRGRPPASAVPIDKVGVKGLRYPIVLLDKAHRRQHTIATISMFVDLPRGQRGTYMGRFVEVLNRHHREIDVHKIGTILKEMREVLGASSAHLEMEFPYFVEKQAPISGVRAQMDYRCWINASLQDRFRLRLGVAVPVTTLCPCSKEMVGKGGHNQRAEIRAEVEFKGFLWLEDLIDLLEECGSSEVYSLLKREDEKHLTNQAYENPVFVEDVVRRVAQRLNEQPLITGYEVEVESFESIHHHEAYACISRWSRE